MKTNNVQIQECIDAGWGYRKISAHLGISENTVKSYIRRHANNNVCMECKKTLKHIKGKKKKKFCSYECRMAWWKKHPDAGNRKAYYTSSCNHCGQLFISYGNNHRKYCSVECYRNHRKGGNIDVK